jgi:microcystin-dependent protein
MVWDFLRSCYITEAILFQGSNISTLIYWYFADASAVGYNQANFMLASSWGTDQGTTGLGEVLGERIWYPGTSLEGFAGDHYCGEAEWMQTGIPLGTPPVNPLVCCGEEGTGQVLLEGEVRLFTGIPLSVAGALVLEGSVPLTMGPGLSPASVGLILEGSVPLSTAAFSPSCGTGLILTGEVVLEVDDVLTGMIVPYAGSTAPSGYLLCNGASVSQTTYAALYALIGTTFGPASGGNFTLPNLTGMVPVGLDPSGAVLPNWAPVDLGTVIGGYEVGLSIAEMPAHSHQVQCAFAAIGASSSTTNAFTGADVASSTVGSGDGHNNVQPGLGMNYLIKT